MNLLDKLRKLFEKPPTEKSYYSPWVEKQAKSYPSENLTPETLAEILKEADEGDTARQYELFSEMEGKDPHLSAVLQTRKLGLAGLSWEIVNEKGESDQVTDFCREIISKIEGFNDILYDLADALGKGFAAAEINYLVKNGKVTIRNIRRVPQERFLFLNQEGKVLKTPRLVTPDEPIYGMELPPGKFIIFRYGARSGLPSRTGLLRPVALAWLIKAYTLKDWIIYNERYAQPFRLGKFPQGATEDQQAMLKKAIQALGTDGAAILPETMLVELVETKTKGQAEYQTLATYCDNLISKAILGQTLTTESGEKGSYALGKVHTQVRYDLREADGRALGECLRRDLLTPLVRWNFGFEALVPYWKFKTDVGEDLQARAEVYKKLVEMGFEGIPTAHIYQLFGIPQPSEGEETLQKQKKAFPFAGKALPGKALPEGKSLDISKEDQSLQVIAEALASQKWEETMGDVIHPIRALLRRSNSLQEFKSRLHEIYPDKNTTQLVSELTHAIFVGQIWGRLFSDSED